MKKKLIGLAIAFALSVPFQSMATVVTVDALANSTTGGIGALVPLSFTVGDSFTVSVNPLDLWNSGPLPRWSNANGQTAPDLLATGSPDTNGDNPGVAAGTVIGGGNFGLYTQNNLTAPYGALVGVWSNNPSNFFLIGTNYVGTAVASTLSLYYFDSNSSDNTGSILADVNITAVPEPETYGMMLIGLSLISFIARRRKNIQV